MNLLKIKMIQVILNMKTKNTKKDHKHLVLTIKNQKVEPVKSHINKKTIKAKRKINSICKKEKSKKDVKKNKENYDKIKRIINLLYNSNLSIQTKKSTNFRKSKYLHLYQ